MDGCMASPRSSFTKVGTWICGIYLVRLDQGPGQGQDLSLANCRSPNQVSYGSWEKNRGSRCSSLLVLDLHTPKKIYSKVPTLASNHKPIKAIPPACLSFTGFMHGVGGHRLNIATPTPNPLFIHLPIQVSNQSSWLPVSSFVVGFFFVFLSGQSSSVVGSCLVFFFFCRSEFYLVSFISSISSSWIFWSRPSPFHVHSFLFL